MMSDYSKKFIVKPGSKIRLKHFDAGYHGNVSPTNALCRKFNSTSRRWRNCNTSCTPNGRTRCSLCFRASTLRAKTALSATFLREIPPGASYRDFKQPTPEE